MRTSNVFLRLITPVATLFSLLGIPHESKGTIVTFEDTCDIFSSQRCFRGQAYSEFKDVNGNWLDSGGQLRSTNTNPFGTLNESGSLGVGSTSLSFRAVHEPLGLGWARAFASLQLNNSANYGGYNVVASGGTRTQVQFIGYGASTPGRIDFGFKVSGNRSTPWGWAFPRLDFLVRPYDPADAGLVDIFFDQDSFNTFTEGQYIYSYSGPVNIPLDILFWSGVGILIGWDDPNNGSFPTPGSSFTSIADYSKTFELESIAFLDQNGDPINQWSLKDVSTGEELFNSKVGRVPGPLPVMGAAATFGWSRRLRRRLRDGQSVGH
jgi:hypothetical protein